jgi:hypothetical protein
MIVAIASAKWDQVDSILTLIGFDESEYLGTIPVVGHCRRRFGFGRPMDEALHAAGT